MPEIGERVRATCLCRTEDGVVVEEASRAEPSIFAIGSATLLPLCEKELMNMVPGQTRVIRLEPDQAFGAYDPALVVKTPRQNLAGAGDLAEGAKVRLATRMGSIEARVIEAEDATVTIDCNHEFAGQALDCELTLLEVVHADAIEREKHPAGCACGCDKLKEALAS